MMRQMLSGGEHSVEPFAARSRCGLAGSIPWSDNFIPGASIQRAHCLLDLGITDHEEAPPLHITAGWRARTGLQDLAD